MRRQSAHKLVGLLGITEGDVAEQLVDTGSVAATGLTSTSAAAGDTKASTTERLRRSSKQQLNHGINRVFGRARKTVQKGSAREAKASSHLAAGPGRPHKHVAAAGRADATDDTRALLSFTLVGREGEAILTLVAPNR